MNLYIPHRDFDFFLEKAKENGAINDIFVSEERLEKVKIAITINDNATVNEVIKTLPIDGMIIDKSTKPSKGYILCVGEIEEEKFELIGKEKHTILTKKNKKIRFNSWIKLTELNYFYKLGQIENFTTINSEVKEVHQIKISTTAEHFEETKATLEKFKLNLTIKDLDIYTSVMLADLKELYEITEKNILKLDIL